MWGSGSFSEKEKKHRSPTPPLPKKTFLKEGRGKLFKSFPHEKNSLFLHP
jgi:hypothetical protein